MNEEEGMRSASLRGSPAARTAPWQTDILSYEAFKYFLRVMDEPWVLRMDGRSKEGRWQRELAHHRYIKLHRSGSSYQLDDEGKVKRAVAKEFRSDAQPTKEA